MNKLKSINKIVATVKRRSALTLLGFLNNLMSLVARPVAVHESRTTITAKLLFVFIALVFIIGCPPPSAKKPPARRPPKIRQPEVSRPAAPAPVMTAQRKASDRLIEKGIVELDTKNYDHALEIFQNAANVDSSNGVAFYYLALTNAYLDEPQVAEGLLDKAEALLRYDDKWMENIEELRMNITGVKPSVTPLPPVIDEF